MLTFLRTAVLLFTAQLRRVVLSKRALICLLLAGVPVAASIIVRLGIAHHGEGPPEIFTVVLGWLFLVQTVVPLIALIVGSAAVAEEIEDRTITYLITRPIPRGAILIGRWAAGLVLVLTLCAASAAVVFALIGDIGAIDPDEPPLPPEIVPRFYRTVLLAGLAYSALFAAAGTFMKHPVLVGLAYTAVVEGFLANLPGANQALTIQYYLKSYLLGDFPELAERYQEFFKFIELEPPAGALSTLGIITVVALGVGVWRLSRRQILLPS